MNYESIFNYVIQVNGNEHNIAIKLMKGSYKMNGYKS